MEYRPLGTTGLQVSVIGYGASPLGGVYHPIDEAGGVRAVHTALDLGVNIIDVAPYYGNTAAETVLGRALRGVDRDRYLLATKVGRYGTDTFDFSPTRARRSVEESLTRLGVEHIDLIQCHDIEFTNLDRLIGETIPALTSLRETGMVRFLGITGYPLTDLAYVSDRTVIDTVLSYCRYTLADTTLLDWTDRFTASGVGIINASPLSMGLLTETGPPDWHPAPPDLRAAARRAAQLCRHRGVDIAQLALQFAVVPASFATTIVGTADPATMARNITWAEQPLDTELATEITAIFADVTRTWPTGHTDPQAHGAHGPHGPHPTIRS